MKIILYFFILSQAALANEQIVSASWMLDVESGKMLKNPIILIKDDVIKEIAYGEKIPSGWGEINQTHLPGYTLTPGLVDMHVHITWNHDMSLDEFFNTSIASSTIIGTQNSKKSLMSGFTTIRNVGSNNFEDVDIRNAIEKGLIDGPRIIASGPFLGSTGSHCDNNFQRTPNAQVWNGVADGPMEIIKKMRASLKYGVDFIKFCTTGGIYSLGTHIEEIQYSQKELLALFEEAKNQGIQLATHAHGAYGIKKMVNLGVNTIEHASMLSEEVIDMAIDKGVYFVMDIYHADLAKHNNDVKNENVEVARKLDFVSEQQLKSFTRAVNRNAKILYGTDAGVVEHGKNARQLSTYIKYGMSHIDAIRSATIWPQEAMGKKNLGLIKEGYLADIIAVKGNPTKMIEVFENVSFVMVGGSIKKYPDYSLSF